MELNDQFAVFFPVSIHNTEDMERLADEIKTFAKTHPFDFKAAVRRAEESPDHKVEKVGPFVRVKGYDPVLFEGWQKMVTFDDGVTEPFQISYLEGFLDELELQQLTIVAYSHQPLTEEMVLSLAAFFWDYDNPEEWDSIRRLEGTPPFVAVLCRHP